MWTDRVRFDRMIAILLLIELLRLELAVWIGTWRTRSHAKWSVWSRLRCAHRRVTLIDRACCDLFRSVVHCWCLGSRTRPESMIIVCRWWWLKRTPLFALLIKNRLASNMEFNNKFQSMFHWDAAIDYCICGIFARFSFTERYLRVFSQRNHVEQCACRVWCSHFSVRSSPINNKQEATSDNGWGRITHFG